MDLDSLKQSILALSDHPAVRRLVQSFLDWDLNDATILSIVVAVTVGLILGRRNASRTYDRPNKYQNIGEELLSRNVLRKFGPPDYHLMNHITLQLENGTTQIDHILVSRYGVFVIETKHYKGWIFANAKSSNWTQVLFHRKQKFQNPVHQNSRHMRAVQNLLDFVAPDFLKSIVVFTGEGEFKTALPGGVFDLPGFIEYLNEQTVEVLSLERMLLCVGRIETARLEISGQTDVEHVHSLELRHGSTT